MSEPEKSAKKHLKKLFEPKSDVEDDLNKDMADDPIEEEHLDENYFTIIMTGIDDPTAACRQWFRKNFKTYMKPSEIVKSIRQLADHHLIHTIKILGYNYDHPFMMMFLSHINSCYGIKDDDYPYLVNDSIASTNQFIVSEIQSEETE